MKELILLKSGEIALKGLNRSNFEGRMSKNAKHRLWPLGKFRIWTNQSITYVMPEDENIDMNEAVSRLQKVFGVAALCRACVTEKDFQDIAKNAVEYLADTLTNAKTFKVFAKRSDKTFPMKSPEICAELGGILLKNFPNLKVDVNNPEISVFVEIRDFAAYIHADQLPGAGGIPVGTGGKATMLLSGGIDSPVAGYMMAKRGLELSAVHFASPPYTSERARQKVIDLAKELVPYTGRMTLYVVPFTEIQTFIRDHGQEDYFTIFMRRSMMRIAERIARKEGAEALITGESVGQVASQTIQAIGCTDVVTKLPILRPCAGMDKEEIIQIARRIETFETSILPFEDCCTVFTPKHPCTRPKLHLVELAEQAMGITPEMEETAAQAAEILDITW